MQPPSSPAYFAVIPAKVRYDRHISDGAKLLYAEITSLCDENGYCWATNQYFADLYGKSRDTISRWMAELSRAEHIAYIVDSAAGSSRKIWLREAIQKQQDPIGKNADTLSAKMPIPIGKNADTLSAKMPIPMGKNAATIGKNADTHTLINSSYSVVSKDNKYNSLTTLRDDEKIVAEKIKKNADQGPQIPPQNSAAPPHPSGPKAGLDIAAEIAEMLRDFRCIERAKMQYGIEAGQMGHLARIFALKLGSEGHHPQNRRDFRNHFFNWAALEVKRLAQLSPTPRTTAAKNRATIQHFNDTEKRDTIPPQKF